MAPRTLIRKLITLGLFARRKDAKPERTVASTTSAHAGVAKGATYAASETQHFCDTIRYVRSRPFADMLVPCHQPWMVAAIRIVGASAGAAWGLLFVYCCSWLALSAHPRTSSPSASSSLPASWPLLHLGSHAEAPSETRSPRLSSKLFCWPLDRPACSSWPRQAAVSELSATSASTT